MKVFDCGADDVVLDLEDTVAKTRKPRTALSSGRR